MAGSLRVIKGGEAMGMGLADYIWLDANGDLAFKKKSILIGRDEKGEPVPLLDRWSFFSYPDEEDEGQTLILSPCYYLPDPTRPQPNYIVLCEVRDEDDHCTEGNYRAKLRRALEARGKQANLVWFGFEQSYSLGEHEKDPDYDGRRFDTAERHIGACFDAGLLLHSAWDHLGWEEWAFKIGYRGFPQDLDPDPPNALVVADHLIIARYLMEKIGASKNLVPEWEDLDIFVSTAELREPGGDEIEVVRELHNLLAPLGDTRALPHPTHGGTQCIEISSEEPGDPYQLALDVLDAVWPLKNAIIEE